VLSTVTANRNIVALGYSFRFDTENETSWEEVMRFMAGTYNLNDSEGVSISDGDKGIARAHLRVFPNRARFRCFEHKKLNLLQHVKGLSSSERAAAIRAYVACVNAATDAAFQVGWNMMPDGAKRHFPEHDWPEYFPLKCTQVLHGWYTSSCAESENNALVDVRAQDPFTALVTLVERCADRMKKQQLCARSYAQERDQVMPGVPPAVVKRLQPTRELAARMASARTSVLDRQQQVYQVGRLSQSAATYKVHLAEYTCCPELKLWRYPCIHICHVCTYASRSVSTCPFVTRSAGGEHS
jgi:hypothetical protein